MAAGTTHEVLPAALVEGVVQRLRAIAAVIDEPAGPALDGHVTELCTQLAAVARALGEPAG